MNIEANTWIREEAKHLGFALCGVVRAEKFPELARSQQWLQRGFGGEMKYLADPRRSDPHSVIPGMRSVVVCALPYNTAAPRTSEALRGVRDRTGSNETHGWISRYAWGDDYHDVVSAKLEALRGKLHEKFPQPFETRVYADTGPINERAFAKYAGLGWLGKNTLLLNEELGSYFFLGVLLTTLDLQPALGTSELPPPDRCGTCRRCIDACPTDALIEPYVMDARKCISYLTIELRGSIPEDLRQPMGQHIFGCDICQDVCPWNRGAGVSDLKEFQPRVYPPSRDLADDLQTPSSAIPRERAFDEQIHRRNEESLFLPRLEWLLSLTEDDFRKVFRGSPVRRTKWRGLIRNVCIALGNSRGLQTFAERQRVMRMLGELQKHADSIVAESAQWAIARIQEVDTKPPNGSDGKLSAGE
jgi:epoxyqueuosine reductase